MAATKVDRDAVQGALFAQWSVLEKLLRGLDSSQWARPTALPGWSVQDIAAHMVGTEAMLDGQATPDAPDSVVNAAHVHGPIAQLNERWVASMRGEDPARIMDRWTALTARRRRAIEAMTQADFDGETDTPVGPESYGRFMRIRVFDCWMHELDIRDAVGVPGDEGGPRSRVAFAEISAALPYIVGKKAQAPDGARVRLELTGIGARTLDIVVTGGRAAIVGADGAAQDAAAPDVTVTMPAGLFVRLAGGRTRADRHAGEIAVAADGDGALGAEAAALGRRILERLSFTI